MFRNAKMSKTDEPSVMYETEDHLSVLLQMHGSVWKRVFWYCIVNTMISMMFWYLYKFQLLDMSFSDKGHSFMAIMVSFLVVARTNIANRRYMEGRMLLSGVMRNCREIVQHAVTISRYETGPKARRWRSDIARRTCSLLRTVVSVLEYDVKKAHVWQLPELSKAEKQALILSVGGCNERSPLVLTIFLRTSIASHVEHLSDPLDPTVELRLLDFVCDFVSAYHGIMKLITAPFPFPLVQMTRTFVFVWVFSLPFALMHTIEEVGPFLFVVFFITYGFLGAEFVSIELETPFGAGENDFDAMGLAEVVFEDIYVAIHDVDGKGAAAALKTSFQLPLTEQIKSAVKGHRRFTRMGSWQGTLPNDVIMKAVTQEMEGGSKSENHANLSSRQRYDRWAETTSRQSVLLQTTQHFESDASIEVFGVEESMKLDLTLSNITLRSSKPKMEKMKMPGRADYGSLDGIDDEEDDPLSPFFIKGGLGKNIDNAKEETVQWLSHANNQQTTNDSTRYVAGSQDNDDNEQSQLHDLSSSSAKAKQNNDDEDDGSGLRMSDDDFGEEETVHWSTHAKNHHHDDDPTQCEAENEANKEQSRDDEMSIQEMNWRIAPALDAHGSGFEINHEEFLGPLLEYKHETTDDNNSNNNRNISSDRKLISEDYDVESTLLVPRD